MCAPVLAACANRGPVRYAVNKVSPKKRFVLILLAGTLVALALALYIGTHRVTDPVYHGQRLSHILDQPTRIWSAAIGGRITTLSSASSGNALTALQELGPRAVPLLVSWLEEHDSTFKARGRQLCARFGLPIPAFFQYRADLALFWLRFIPQYSSSAAPVLISKLADADELQLLDIAPLLEKIIETASKEDRARIAQSCVPLVPTLLERASHGAVAIGSSEITFLLKNILQYGRFDEAQREALLQQIVVSAGPDSSPWTSDRLADALDSDYTLRNELLLRSGISSKQSSAAEFFRTNPVKPDRIIPLLRSCLSSTNRNLVEQSAKALGAYGAAATDVLPELRALLLQTSGYVVNAASNAIVAIDPSASRR
jgi:hypothetical protein